MKGEYEIIQLLDERPSDDKLVECQRRAELRLLCKLIVSDRQEVVEMAGRYEVRNAFTIEVKPIGLEMGRERG